MLAEKSLGTKKKLALSKLEVVRLMRILSGSEFGVDTGWLVWVSRTSPKLVTCKSALAFVKGMEAACELCVGSQHHIFSFNFTVIKF